MTKKATTKDELLLLKLHEMALREGDPFGAIESHALGRAIGQNDRGTYTIIRDLAQANFIKKADGDAIYLTSNGLALVNQLLAER